MDGLQNQPKPFLDALARRIAQKLRDPFLILDANLRVRFANNSFYQSFHTTPADTEDHPLCQVANGFWDIPALRPLLERMLSPESSLKNAELAHSFEALGPKMIVLNGYEWGPYSLIFVTVEDTASVSQAELLLIEAYNELELRIRERTVELTEANARLVQEIAERQRIEAALKASEAHLSGILDIAVDAIITTGSDQRITLFNRGAEFIFGYPASEVLGQSLAVLLPPRFAGIHERHMQTFAASTNGAARRMFERGAVWGRRKDGTEFPAEASISKLWQADQWTFTVILRDITGRFQLEQELRTALAKEKEINELKSRFISMVSHEIRTPLSVILSSTDLLERYGDRMSEQRRGEGYQEIRQQIAYLTALLENTLTVNQAESVGLEFNPNSCDLEKFCQDIVQKFQLLTRETHQITFTSSNSAQPVSVDENLLWQILTNLLSNAVKFSPQGGSISVHLACASGQATIQVHDKGIGIPETDYAHILENFYRGSNVGAIPGTGLGLAIVKQAVKAHGGRISYQSVPGQGTTFTVALPV